MPKVVINRGFFTKKLLLWSFDRDDILNIIGISINIKDEILVIFIRFEVRGSISITSFRKNLDDL